MNTVAEAQRYLWHLWMERWSGGVGKARDWSQAVPVESLSVTHFLWVLLHVTPLPHI